MAKRIRKLRGLAITHISLITGRGTDRIHLVTNKPSTTPKVTDNHLAFNFEVEAGKGKQYLLDVFGLTPDLEVDLATYETKGKPYNG